jgi:group I intron endonuclease
VNGKVYVGQTKDFANRKAGHLYEARNGNDRPLYRSIRKHGKENFSFEILEECEDSVINERERHWVAHYDSFNSDKGYNLTAGGDWTSGEISGMMKKCWQNPIYRSIKSRQSSEWLNQRWRDPDYRKRRSEQMSKLSRQWHREGKINNTFAGKTHTNEAKLAIGRANSVKQRGERNSQFGTAWIHDGKGTSRKIKKEELQAWLDRGWTRGRKMK